MTDQDWKDLGYRFTPSNGKYEKGIWQRKLWRPPGSEASDALGYLTWSVYVFPTHTGYQAEADLDMADGPMGIRRMSWNPRVISKDVVQMVEAEYRRMAETDGD